MPTAKEFARDVEALALTVTGYQTGKSGQNGLCDCIGLIMGAMARLGRSSYPMHSTNYFARYQMQWLREDVPDMAADDFKIGQLVYKGNPDGSDLNNRYKPGGRYYTGDLFDYYHVGVVTDTSPLEITHCTSYGSISGIVRDSSTRGWTHVGELMGVEYAADAAGQEEETMASQSAYIEVPAGTSTANLRSRPNKSAPLIKRVNKGTVVDVLEQADGWAKIEDPKGDRGYMMLDFLKFLERADEDAPNSGEDAPQEAIGAPFEQDVLKRLERIETLLNAILDKAGGEG